MVLSIEVLVLISGKILENERPPRALFDLGRQLNILHKAYLHRLHEAAAQFMPGNGKAEITRFVSNLQGLFKKMLPASLVANNIAAFFRQQCSIILTPHLSAKPQQNDTTTDNDRQRTLQFVRSLQNVGLGGNQAERIFAEIMSEILTSFIKSTYAHRWKSPSKVMADMQDWIENRFARLIVEVLAALNSKGAENVENLTSVSQKDVEMWKEMGVYRLGVLRTEELFDIVVDWDESRGAIEDLKKFITVPTSRAYLTGTFSSILSHRLLQPGASTTEILQVYISIIRAFTALDPKGVLLDRVARPIRRYLRDRDDTVSIVVGGLLSDPEDGSAEDDVLLELAVEMNYGGLVEKADEGDHNYLDYDDMEWTPAPVDAGPEYKRGKSSDVIGSLISLFESKEVFVKEFQKVLGERLLKGYYEFDREIRVLELLKIRFGEAALQACEVMLRDIIDSRRVDAFIHRDQNMSLDSDHGTQLHSCILSHLFWPSLHSETFQIPSEIVRLQAQYSTGYEAIKQSRKLTWLHALGQVTVNLDLEDRTVEEDVQTWQASVIYAFQPSDNDDPMVPVTRTFDELLENLEMTEILLQNALTFWIGKLVLKQISTEPAVYTVLESLSDEDAANPGTLSAATAAAAETATAAAAPAVMSEHEVAQEKMDVYAQYVNGMLTNGGPMPLQQIVMMLKLTVPGGFPFGNEELKSFLEEEVKAGRLDYSGGTYRMKH